MFGFSTGVLRGHVPRKTIHHTVQTSWWSGQADIPTYHAEELLATKLRALYQRSKGRDLFDIWLGLTILNADPEQITASKIPGAVQGAAYAPGRKERPARNDPGFRGSTTSSSPLGLSARSSYWGLVRRRQV